MKRTQRKIPVMLSGGVVLLSALALLPGSAGAAITDDPADAFEVQVKVKITPPGCTSVNNTQDVDFGNNSLSYFAVNSNKGINKSFTLSFNCPFNNAKNYNIYVKGETDGSMQNLSVKSQVPSLADVLKIRLYQGNCETDDCSRFPAINIGNSSQQKNEIKGQNPSVLVLNGQKTDLTLTASIICADSNQNKCSQLSGGGDITSSVFIVMEAI